ncbi:MAG: packaged DNA stabilization protein [Pseudomonadota bacterium]
MPIQPISFGLESRPGRYGAEGGASLVNAFVEEMSPDGKAPVTIYCRPGLSSFAALTGSGGFRGAIKLGPLAYVVSGPIVNRVDQTGAVANVGAFVGSSPVRMARNRKSPNAQIALVSDGQRAILENDTLSTIADADLPPPNDVCSIGGYFVFSTPDGRYFWTSIDEGTQIDALDFASAEANPDGLVGIIDRNQEIVLLGEETTEFHALTGSSAVFERVQQTTLQLGWLSGAAVKSINGIPIGPASDGTVRVLADYSPERVSTHEVERDIRALSDPGVLTGGTFSLDGHQFYCLNSPTWTWVCDLLTRKWFQWKSYGSSRWRGEGFVDIDDKLCVGDYENAVLYCLEADGQTDAGDPLVWDLTSGPIGGYPNRIIADELYLEFIPGVGLNSTDKHASDPKVMLRVSTDDGKTWSDEMVADLGGIGEFKTEVSFRRLGMSGREGFRFRVSVSAPVSRALLRASLRYTEAAA